MELVFKLKPIMNDLCRAAAKVKNGIFHRIAINVKKVKAKSPEKMEPRRKPIIDSAHVDHFLSMALTHAHTQQ